MFLRKTIEDKKNLLLASKRIIIILELII